MVQDLGSGTGGQVAHGLRGGRTEEGMGGSWPDPSSS